MQPLLVRALVLVSTKNVVGLKHRGSNAMGCANPKARPSYIISPDGHCLTEDELPPAGSKHWNGYQKAQVVAAVEGGLISQYEARCRYALSMEEYLTWKVILQQFGIDGLQASRAQAVRNATRH